MSRKLIEIASEIVQTQVSLTPMSAAEIALSLRQVFSALQELQRAESVGTDVTVAQEVSQEAVTQEESVLTPESSIQKDKVICLECRAEMKQLTQKHLSAHGLTTKEYRKKYGFSMKTPLSAKSLTKARSKAAKKRGLPENLKKAIEAKRQSKAQAMTAPDLGASGAQVDKEVKKRGGRKKTA